MDAVAFFTYPSLPSDDWAPERRWGIRVNGDDLRLIAAEATRDLWLAEYEFEADPDDGSDHITGQHSNLDAADLAAPSRLLYGEPDDDYRTGPEPPWAGRVPLLGCGACEIWACWPLLARVDADARSVRWSGFVQPHRGTWGELDIGPYEFARAAYEQATAVPGMLTVDPLTTWRTTQ
ncbi:hypothetical protein [Catellatospora tritici]|uniref:hypothetical protein n=1 Tax=Catellatospora tritici TaxID=2851566 RepID=UPI001C2DBA78|nr:hypothetical protein [Catellatospora tritici]MBV1851489.1 hypothetical protein [Catellatospora tritici]